MAISDYISPSVVEDINTTSNVFSAILAPQQLNLSKLSVDLQRQSIKIDRESREMNKKILKLTEENLEHTLVLYEILAELKKLNRHITKM